MAQTKAKPKSKSSKPKSATSKPKSARVKASTSATGKARSSSNGSPSGQGSKSETVRHAVEDVGGKAKSAGKSVGKAAGKAKMPLVAGGAAIAGAAGGMALASSRRGRKSGIGATIARRPRIKIDSGDVAKAAKEVGNFSAQVGELANEVRRARDAGNEKHRSPVEVVLQGLTARR